MGNDAEIKYRDAKLDQAIGTDSTKGEVAGHRRPAGAEGIGRWQEFPDIGKQRSREFRIDPWMGNDAEKFN